MLMQVVREMFEALTEDPWIVKENFDISVDGVLDESCLIIWINPNKNNKYISFIHEAIHIVRPGWEEGKVERQAVKIWLETTPQLKDVIQDWYMFLCLESKKEANNYGFISDLEMHDYIRTQRGR